LIDILNYTSKNNIGSFAVSFVYGSKQVGHVLISTTPEGHVLADTNPASVFSNLTEVIEHYKEALLTPFQSQTDLLP
jgi:hypothetical protein